jgi:hypothetical protein
MTRRSKIARLPSAIREELNRRLLEGQSAPQILPWLNALPESKRVIAEMPTAGGHGITAFDDKNLSVWRQGGYEEWLRHRERIAQTKELAGYSIKLAHAAGGNIAEGAAAMLAGQLLEIMEALRETSLAAPESDEGGAAPRANDPAAIAKAVDSVSKAIAQVRAGDHSAQKLALDRRKADQADEALKLERLRLSALLDKAAERLLDETLRQQAAAIANSSLSNADKIAALRKAAFSDVDALEASGSVQLPQ